MTGARKTILRLAVAVVFAVPTVLISTTAVAHPSKSQVQSAKARLATLNHSLEVFVEQYDQAKLKLEQTQSHLADVRRAKARADAEAAAFRSELDQRAVAAYTGMGSQLNVLLGAQTFTDFSDRLQFMGALAQSDADLAAQADAAGARSRWAAQELAKTVAQQQQEQTALQQKIDQIKSSVSQQQRLYDQLNRSYNNFLSAERAAEQQAASGGSVGSGGYNSPPPPPPNTSAAQTAIYYARSVIGTQYVWGAADPSVGFDCSGLTMWAWAHAGVSLPHSSAAQYEMLPHVSRDQLTPGDLVFFYSPISHVGLYIGGDQMIDASHPGPGGGVAVRTIYWQYFTGAGRPG